MRSLVAVAVVGALSSSVAADPWGSAKDDAPPDPPTPAPRWLDAALDFWGHHLEVGMAVTAHTYRALPAIGAEIRTGVSLPLGLYVGGAMEVGEIVAGDAPMLGEGTADIATSVGVFAGYRRQVGPLSIAGDLGWGVHFLSATGMSDGPTLSAKHLEARLAIDTWFTERTTLGVFVGKDTWSSDQHVIGLAVQFHAETGLSRGERGLVARILDR